MEKAQEQLLSAGLQTVTGVMSMRKFLVTTATVLIANPIVISGSGIMEYFYIPENSLVALIAVMAFFGVFASIAWAGRLRYLHATEDKWEGRYVFSMILNMAVAPVVSVMFLGIFVQQYMPGLNIVSYFLLLVITIICMSALCLLTINYGFKYTLSAFKPVLKEAQEAAAEAKAAGVEINANLKH